MCVLALTSGACWVQSVVFLKVNRFHLGNHLLYILNVLYRPVGARALSKIAASMFNHGIVNTLNRLSHFNFAVDKNGDVCISILHEPGEDKYGYEKPEERWLPIHTVETIMISVISMLADPNGDSPANVDAAVSWSCTMFPSL